MLAPLGHSGLAAELKEDSVQLSRSVPLFAGEMLVARKLIYHREGLL